MQIDVSRVLTTLGVMNKAHGFIGGFTGEELEGRMLNQGVACDFVRISNETCTNITVRDMTKGTQTTFTTGGPEVEPYELMQMIHKVKKFQEPDMVILSGSLPPGVHSEIYCRMIAIVKGKGPRVILDSDGDALTKEDRLWKSI
jgi:fructose-1-phosphate kinase PfkB-like protein